jgi:hypothetical protein
MDAARERRLEADRRWQRTHREVAPPAPDFGILMERPPTVADFERTSFEHDAVANVLMLHDQFADDVVSTPLPLEATAAQIRDYEAAIRERCKVTDADAQECIARYRSLMSHE